MKKKAPKEVVSFLNLIRINHLDRAREYFLKHQEAIMKSKRDGTYLDYWGRHITNNEKYKAHYLAYICTCDRGEISGVKPLD